MGTKMPQPATRGSRCTHMQQESKLEDKERQGTMGCFHKNQARRFGGPKGMKSGHLSETQVGGHLSARKEAFLLWAGSKGR